MLQRSFDPYTAGDRLAGRAASSLLARSGRLRSPQGATSLSQLASVAGWMWRHRAITTTALVLLVVYAATGETGVWLVLGLVAAALVVLRWRAPRRFDWLVNRCRRGWRITTLYEPLWRDTMAALGLARIDGRGNEAIPRFRRVRSDRFGDRMLVKLAPGQFPPMLEMRSEAIAHSFGALSCRVTPGPRPGWVRLNLRCTDPLTDIIDALDPAPADRLDLSRLHVGYTEEGRPWHLSLAGGSNVLIAGAAGAGKGSVEWSIIRALAPAIAAGTVQVWAVDPKGGMELAPGAGLFHRFAYPAVSDTGTGIDATPMVELLEDAARELLIRAEALRASGARKFTATTEHPAVILLVDEVATLTKYLIEDKKLANRAIAALSIVLSQGRAPGFSLVMAVQDPRKDSIPFRDLISTRVGLRLPEPAAADLVLGDGAYKRGALCDQIPADTPGVGYVMLDGQAEPTRVRAAYVTDDDIAAMVATYGTSLGPTLTAVEDDPGDGDGDGEGVAA
jgi:S-DNA-T family DNA segregation ATPase FtsK/SpoIIIE